MISSSTSSTIQSLSNIPVEDEVDFDVRSSFDTPPKLGINESCTGIIILCPGIIFLYAGVATI